MTAAFWAQSTESGYVVNSWKRLLLVVQPVLKDVLRGFNGAILAYGQTGAGKTHSLLNSGGKKPAEAGLLPRTVAALFVYIGGDAQHVYSVEAGAFQIYNEQVDDLLNENRNTGSNLTVKTGGEVLNLTWVQCKSPDELLNHFQSARNNVIYAETKMNKASSRSHSIFQIKITRRPRAMENKGLPVKMHATVGKLTVVDLAGSERVKRSGVQGQGLKEAANINASLLAFGNVVQALADKKKHVPFRDSKLTRILEDSVGGNCKTSLLVCCSPVDESSSETQSALDFASRAMRVECTAVVNETSVAIDASQLAADLAGEGIDAAVQAKAKELQALQERSTIQEKKAKDAAKKAEAGLTAVLQEETKKLDEQKSLVSKWKAAAEAANKQAEVDKVDMQKRYAAVEADAMQAREGHEAKAKLKTVVAELLHIKAELAKTKTKAEEEKATITAQLATVSASSSEETAAREATEAALADTERQMNELKDHLRATREALEATKVSASASAAAAAASKDAAMSAAAARHAAEVSKLKATFLAQLDAKEKEMAAMRADHNRQLAEVDAKWMDKMERTEESAATARQDLESRLMCQIADERSMAADDLATLTEHTQIDIRCRERERDAAKEETRAADARARQAREDGETSVLEARHLAAMERQEISNHAEERILEEQVRHEEEAEAIYQEGVTRERRQAGAFAAARQILAMKISELESSMAVLQGRFDRRESRGEDIKRIRMLQNELKGAQKEQRQQTFEATQLKLALDNRDETDRVFGLGRPKGSREPLSPIIQHKPPAMWGNHSQNHLSHAGVSMFGNVRARPGSAFVSSNGFKR
jgi:kinesin family protein 5